MDIITNLLSDRWFDGFPLIGLYAETHFRFRIPLSRYFKREPELIFDAPWRLQPHQTPTIFLVIKDAHLYPTFLKAVEIEVTQGDLLIGRQTWKLDQDILEPQTFLEFPISDFKIPIGEVEFTPRLDYTVKGKSRRMVVDNYPQIEKRPLRITMADETLPAMPGWQTGDTHLHTSLTNDQIEFGASLDQTRKCAQLFGLDFMTATDHSYDLDDKVDDYLTNDPELEKWKASRRQIQEMNDTHELTIIPGEEISVANSRGATVHFLHFNDPVYFPGSGDSGEDWPKLTSQLTIDDVLNQRSPQTVSVGAHTAYKFPLFQRILLKRGFWEASDHMNPELDGVQILCGTPAFSAFQESRQLWIDTLLTGRKLAVYGGSDGHGNFNRNWHVTLPVWSLNTHEDQIFAQARTLLRSELSSVDDLVQAMKSRRTALSTGPVGDLKIDHNSQSYGIGDSLSIKPGQGLDVNLSGLSSSEFGSLMDVTLYWGDYQTQTENIISHEVDLEHAFNLQLPFRANGDGYLRIEISSEGSRWPGVFISSPLWISINNG